MTDDAARVLRETLEQMANACSVDMELWDKHANAVLTAAARIEALVGERDELLRGAEAWKPMVRALEARADALAKELAETQERLHNRTEQLTATAKELAEAREERDALAAAIRLMRDDTAIRRG